MQTLIAKEGNHSLRYQILSSSGQVAHTATTHARRSSACQVEDRPDSFNPHNQTTKYNRINQILEDQPVWFITIITQLKLTKRKKRTTRAQPWRRSARDKTHQSGSHKKKKTRYKLVPVLHLHQADSLVSPPCPLIFLTTQTSSFHQHPHCVQCTWYQRQP